MSKTVKLQNILHLTNECQEKSFLKSLKLKKMMMITRYIIPYKHSLEAKLRKKIDFFSKEYSLFI